MARSGTLDFVRCDEACEEDFFEWREDTSLFADEPADDLGLITSLSMTVRAREDSVPTAEVADDLGFGTSLSMIVRALEDSLSTREGDGEGIGIGSTSSSISQEGRRADLADMTVEALPGEPVGIMGAYSTGLSRTRDDPATDMGLVPMFMNAWDTPGIISGRPAASILRREPLLELEGLAASSVPLERLLFRMAAASRSTASSSRRALSCSLLTIAKATAAPAAAPIRVPARVLVEMVMFPVELEGTTPAMPF
jgi:hypothetical protein